MRHNGNWGILVDEERQTAEIAPVYDCGSCLYPQLGTQEMEAVLNDESEINRRIHEYPQLENMAAQVFADTAVGVADGFAPGGNRGKFQHIPLALVEKYLYQQFPERLWDRAGFYPPSNGGADAHPGRPAEGPFLGCIYCGRAAGEL